MLTCELVSLIVLKNTTLNNLVITNLPGYNKLVIANRLKIPSLDVDNYTRYKNSKFSFDKF